MAAAPSAGTTCCTPTTNHSPQKNGNSGSSPPARLYADIFFNDTATTEIYTTISYTPTAINATRPRRHQHNNNRLQHHLPAHAGLAWAVCGDKSHARSLGGGGAAMRRRYPARRKRAWSQAPRWRPTQRHVRNCEGRGVRFPPATRRRGWLIRGLLARTTGPGLGGPEWASQIRRTSRLTSRRDSYGRRTRASRRTRVPRGWTVSPSRSSKPIWKTICIGFGIEYLRGRTFRRRCGRLRFRSRMVGGREFSEFPLSGTESLRH